MKKLYCCFCYISIGLLLSVNGDEIDDMLQLESLFNLDVKQVEAVSNNIDEVVAVEEESVQPKVQSITPAGVSRLSRAELEIELAAYKQEVVRLKDIVKRILEANRREKSAIQYNMGCVFRNAGHYLESEKSFLKALEVSPDDSTIHYNLGILYDEDLKVPAKAREHYKRFLELAPDDKDAGKVYEWMMALE